MNRQRVPDKFPRMPQPGTVSGAQPKLLLREIGGTYRPGPTDDELYERYMLCEDLAQQLAAYTSRKMIERKWSSQTALSTVEAGVIKKVRSGLWDFSDAEVAWTIERTRQILTVPTAADTSLAPNSNIPNQAREDNRDE